MNESAWLARTSRLFGADIDMVQGTGGNVSVKAGGGMLIKSSGVRLDSVSESSGYTMVDYERIASLYGSSVDEKSSNDTISESVIGGTGSPSIETGFHSFLARHVAHMHPASVNVILCSEDGRSIARELGAAWVPYVKVGHLLSKAVWASGARDGLIFLGNHGVVSSSASGEGCVDLMFSARERAVAYLSKSTDFKSFVCGNLKNMNGSFINPVINSGNCGSLMEKFLFPDAVVFSSSDKIEITDAGIVYHMPYESARNVNEILSAHVYIEVMISGFSRPLFLKRSDVNDILGMESEKYRQRRLGL